MTRTLAAHIAGCIAARANCIRLDRSEMQDMHEDNLHTLANLLPSGSGIDQGTSINLERSSPLCIVLDVPFHHMTEHGYYDGWTDYTIRVRPDFAGISITIPVGRDRNGIKDYLVDTYYYALTREYTVIKIKGEMLYQEVSA